VIGPSIRHGGDRHAAFEIIGFFKVLIAGLRGGGVTVTPPGSGTALA
jgi:hypothetical protein